MPLCGFISLVVTHRVIQSILVQYRVAKNCVEVVGRVSPSPYNFDPQFCSPMYTIYIPKEKTVNIGNTDTKFSVGQPMLLKHATDGGSFVATSYKRWHKYPIQLIFSSTFY